MLKDYVDRKAVARSQTAARELEKFSGIADDSLFPAERSDRDTLRLIAKKDTLPTVSIDLHALLMMSRPDGLPLWTIASPYSLISRTNGCCQRYVSYTNKTKFWFEYREEQEGRGFSVDNSPYYVGNGVRSQVVNVRVWGGDRAGVEYNTTAVQSSKYQPIVPTVGFPVLPQRIRELLRTPEIQKCVTVAVLYQPMSWESLPIESPDPDPALLVRKTHSDVFECVAIWGHDGAQIQEFTTTAVSD